MKPFIVNTIAADYVTHPRYNYVNNLTNYRTEQAVMRAVPMGEGIIDYDTVPYPERDRIPWLDRPDPGSAVLFHIRQPLTDKSSEEPES